MSNQETTIAEFDWHGESWSIRPTYEETPECGEYLLKPATRESWTPMNRACLFRHAGIADPEHEPPLETLAIFFELTAQVTPESLHTVLCRANELRPTCQH